jgi:hypothetical protein
MFDETNNPQPTDPPSGSTGGGGHITSDLEEPENAEAMDSEPPTSTGGGG